MPRRPNRARRPPLQGCGLEENQLFDYQAILSADGALDDPDGAAKVGRLDEKTRRRSTSTRASSSMPWRSTNCHHEFVGAWHRRTGACRSRPSSRFFLVEAVDPRAPSGSSSAPSADRMLDEVERWFSSQAASLKRRVVGRRFGALASLPSCAARPIATRSIWACHRLICDCSSLAGSVIRRVVISRKALAMLPDRPCPGRRRSGG